MKDKKSFMDWKESELYKFTKDHQVDVESWGGYVGKDDGYEPWGYRVEYDGKQMFYNLDGSFVKAKAV